MAKDECALDQSHGGAPPHLAEPPPNDSGTPAALSVDLLSHPRSPRPVASDLAGGEELDVRAELWEDSLFRSSLVTALLGAGADNATFAVAGQLAQVNDRAVRGVYLERLRDLAHDLNTPVNAVHGFLKLAMDSEDPLTRQQQELLDFAATAADQLIRLVGDMHDSMYLSSGKLALHLSPVDPVDLARTAVAGCSLLAAESGLRLACLWRPNMPTIRADRRRVERILGNLLQNAIKFAPPGTEIQVGIEIDGTKGVRFTVEDEGPGFDEQEIGRLFALSFQGGSAGARATGGHGLGLSIAHALAAAHGGRMVAANRAGGGAHFALVLPLDPATTPGRV